MDVRALDGRSIGRVTHNTTPINLRVSGNHSETIQFLLINSCSLNHITVKNCYLLPHNSSVFEPLQGATVFSKLDLRNAYHLVGIREGDKWKTAFNTASAH